MVKQTKESRDAFYTIAVAVAKYIKIMGGTALIVGGVGIGQDIGAKKFNYFIRIDITGKKPTLTPDR